jgi:hypothetical protein
LHFFPDDNPSFAPDDNNIADFEAFTNELHWRAKIPQNSVPDRGKRSMIGVPKARGLAAGAMAISRITGRP